MSSQEVSFRDLCYGRLIREIVLVALCRTFFGCPSGAQVKPAYRGIIGIDLGLAPNELPRFLEGDRNLAVKIFNQARTDRIKGTQREPKLKISEEDDRYLFLFLRCYKDALTQQLSESDIISRVNSIRMNEEEVTMDVVLRRYFKDCQWTNFFVNVLSSCSYDLAFGKLGRKNHYSDDDLSPQFLLLRPATDLQETLPKKKVRVRRKGPPKLKKKKANDSPTVSAPVDPAPVFTGDRLARFQRFERLYRKRVPAVSSGELTQDMLLAVGFPGQTPFASEIIRAWIDSGENQEIEQFLTNAGIL